MDIIDELENLFHACIRLIQGRIKLFLLEFKLAKLAVKPLLFFLIILLCMVFSIWLDFLALIAYGLYLLTTNIYVTLTATFFTNLLAIVCVYTAIKYFIKQGSFQRTRAFLNKKPESLPRDERNIQNKKANS